MGRRRQNFIDDSIMEFPRGGFWAIHFIGAVLLFFMGMRFAVRRAPFPMVAYRFLRMLTHH
ncbi:Hypothetical protein LUCI_3979 [Lucifera butyrica]|uniref:Uncharacterized protein n=1 Tax=Lucifera butyrica TaxID=1351585 RepID=A0A498RB77_9FIRM|nr:hypothetical protein [Lucifera butyrica]VBB08701.1 Hypothetical protein LUCI_3979 [Lucifera butyrica]